MPDLKQALKDFVATSNSGIYKDEATLLSKFPELRGYNINALRDFVATANSGSYQTEDELFAKFPEFKAAPAAIAPAAAAPTSIAPAEEVKKKGQGTMAQMVPKNTTESFVEESLSASQPKAQVAPKAQAAPKQKPGILAQPVPKTTTESFLAAASAEPSVKPTAVQPPVKEKNYFTGDFGTLLTVADVVTPFGLGEFIDDIGRSVASGYRSGALVTPTTEVMIQGKKVSDEQLKKYVQAAKEMEGIGPSDEMQNFSKIYEESGKGVFGVLKGLAYNPTVLPEILIQSTAMLANPTALASAATTLAAGAATGAPGGIPGIVAGIARAIPYAMGAASTTLETGLTFSELLREELDKKGLEFNEKNVKDLLQDDKVVSSLRGRSVARGATIGIVDALTGKLAGKIGGKLLAKGTSAARTRAGVAAAGIESIGGSAGEAAGRLAAGQEMDTAEIVLEGVAEAPMALPSLAAEVLNRPIYKINGQRVTENDVKDIVDNTPAEDLGKINFEFKNDRSGYQEIIQKKVVTDATKQQVREANPDLNEPSLDAITKLELDLQKLQGNTTQSGKDKAAAIRQQIKGIQENQLQAEAAQQNVLGAAYRSQRISDVEKALAQPENKEGTVTIDNKQVPRAEAQTELETLKTEQNAIQEQTAGQVPVQSETGTSVQVAEGEPQAEPQGVTQEVETEEVKTLRAQEQAELVEAIPNAEEYVVDGKVDRTKLKDPKDLKAFDDIYEKYDKLITPLLPTTEVSLKTPTEEVTVEATPVSETVVIDGVEYSREDAREKSRQNEAVPIYGSRMEYSGNDEQTKRFVQEYNRTSNPYTLDGKLKGSYIQQNIVKALNEMNFRKFGDLYRKHIDPYFSRANNEERLTRNFSWRELADYIISDTNYEVGEYDAKFRAFAKEAGITIPENQTTQIQSNEQATTQPQQNEQVQPQRTGDGRRRTDSRKITPLEGSPSVKGINGPDPQLVAVAEQYAADNGIDLKRQSEYVKVDEERAKRIADAYEQMADDPQNPKVKEAYQELIKQTIAQYQALVDAGYKFWFMDLNIPSNLKYAESPYNALRDMRENQEMGVFPTTDGYGEGALTELDVDKNPLLADTGIEWPVGGLDGPMKPVLANDLFRAVHDAFGHGLEGAGFRARGEENAWQAHARLFTGPAIGAITSETRGQNSWLNYGPEGEKNRTAKVEDTVFAEQKIGLMPEWTWTEGRAGDMDVEVEAVEEQAPTKKVPAKKAPAKAEPVQVDEQLPSKLQKLVDLISLAFFQPFGTTKAESQNRKRTSEESKEKLTELLGADFKNDGSRSDEDKLIVNSLGAIKRFLDKTDKKFKFETIQDLLTAYQNDKTNGVDSDLVKSVDTVLNAQRDVADIEAAANEAVAEEGEAYEPITVKDISYNTFTRDNASEYEEDEREGDNGRSYTYFSSISVPIINNQDGETIGYLVKMADSDGELTFDAQFEDQESISGEEGDVFGTLGAAREAFIEAYNKKKQEELAAEATEKAKEKAREAVKTAKKTAKAAAKEGAAKVEEVQATLDELLALDPNDKSTAQKASDALGKAIKDIEKFEKTSLGVNIALPIVKGILQAVKTLIDAGISLQQALKQVAKDNNITEQQVKDNINIAPILGGFGEVMTKVDALIARQKSKGITDAKIVSNIDTFIRNTEVYQAANDAQKKILEKEGRAKMGVDERRAPSIGRVLGALKDITNISKQDKIKIIRQIRGLSQDAAKSLAKEIKEMATVGKITVNQAANVISRFSKVNMLSEVSVSNFVDYMAKVFNDAEYAQKIDVVKKQLSTAKKNIQTKIGIADGLMIPLQKLFAINPNFIPDAVFDEYVALVDMFGKKQTVLSLDEKSSVQRQVQDILDAVNAEQSEVIDLAARLEDFKGTVFNEDGKIDYAATLKKMIDDEVISEDEAEIMRKYKSDILPQAETPKKTDAEIEAEKKELIKEILDTTTAANLPSRDERELAVEFLRLRRTDAIYDLSVAELKNIIKLVENIRNGYLPHYAQLMVEKLTAINNAKELTKAINQAKPLSLTEAYAKVKSLFTGKAAILEMIRRNPLANIDQVFGNFKTKEVFNTLFNKAAEAAAAFQTDLKKVQNILEKAEAKVAESFKLDPNKTLMSKFKMMTYMIQLEFNSNPDNKQVNKASDFLKATIKHIENGKSRFGDRDAQMLSEILEEYSDSNGNIDINKLYESFNPAEKSAIKAIQSVNQSLTDKAEYTASVIRGQKFNPLNNYVHLNVLNEAEPTDLTMGSSFATEYNNSMRPSTKAKSLIERTGKVSPLNFDVFASAQRGAKFVLMDYNLTEPIRTARKTLNQTESNLEGETGKMSKKDRDVFNAIRDAFEESVENLLTNAVVSNSLADDVVDYINKQGYRAILAGTGRFIGELSSNIGFALISDPKAFTTGYNNRAFIMSTDAPLVMQNVKSKQTSRIFPTDTLSGRAIDTSILSQAGGIVGGKSKNAVANQIQKIWNLSGKKYTNAVELMADSLISTPDKIVMRPLWFGSFANTFKTITGQDVNFDKIAANDEEYMNRNQQAIQEAKKIADERSVMTGATDNPFMGVLKGTIKPNQSFTTRAFNNFNNFMTKFLIFEYTTARTGVMAAMGNGSLSKKQGVALLGAVTTRMIVYTLVGQMLGNGLMGMFYDDEEPEDDKSFLQKAGQAIASTFTSLLLGRDFGNATKAIVNAGVETINEKYFDFLREGEYDPYKDAIQFSVIPKKREGKQNDLGDLLMNMGGAFGPSLKTANFLYVKATEDDKKKADAIERQEKERSIRVPLEILGNAGFIPLYKDVRKMVMKNLYSDLINAEQNLANKKMAEQEKLQGFETEGDMKRYDPELWDRTYGPSSEGYDERDAARKLKLESQRMKRAIKDKEYNYTPKTRKKGDGFGSKKGFGDSKSRSRSKSDGFGSKDGFSSK